MSTSAIWACLAALAQFQACGGDAQAAPVLAKADRLDMDRGAVIATPARAVSAGYSAHDWSGFYIGGSLGYGWGGSEQQYIRNNNHGMASVSPDGFAGSLTGGYNFMISPSFLIGAEADLGVMNLTQNDKVVYDGHIWKPQFGPFWGTLRARAGWLLGDSILFYATGGMAFMQTDNITVGNTEPETSWDKDMRTGWVLGAGVEYALFDNWTAKAEYLYMDFGKYSGYSANQEPYWYKDDVSLFRVGVNFRF